MTSHGSQCLQPQLVMARLGLHGLPPLAVPAGAMVRHYWPGDEQAWERIITASFGGGERTFQSIMANAPAFRPERVWFIARDGQLVATAAAWRDERFGEQTGYVHMVGVEPRHRGRQLGYWVSLAALHQLAREGITHAVLQTDDHRLAAIATYQRLDFQPVLVHENQVARWQAIFKALEQARQSRDAGGRPGANT